MQKYEKTFRKRNNFSYFLIRFHLTVKYPRIVFVEIKHFSATTGIKDRFHKIFFFRLLPC